MLASTVLIPTEAPPSLLDIKRALLTYETVYLPHPDDRDLIPPEYYTQVTSPVPFGMVMGGVSMGRVRPLGKILRYDDLFSETLEAASAAQHQGLVKLLPTPRGAVPPGTLMLGWAGPPEGMPPCEATYELYRNLALHEPMMRAVHYGREGLDLLRLNDVDTLAPMGIDEQQMGLQPPGGEWQPIEPPLFNVDVPGIPADERLALSRLAWARLGSIVKWVGAAHVRDLQPYACDTGLTAALRLITDRARVVAASAPDELGGDVLRRLALVHELLMAEFIDEELLNAMSVEDVIRERTRGWANVRAAQGQFERRLHELAESTSDAAEFERACRKQIDEYLAAVAKADHSRLKLITGASADLAFGAIFGGTGGVFQAYASAGSWKAALWLAAAYFAKQVKGHVNLGLDLLRERTESRRLPGFSLTRPYDAFIRRPPS